MALQEGSDKKNIKDYTLKMANHPDPSNIGGCESCPSGDSLKIVFNTGWAIVYQVLGVSHWHKAQNYMTYRR